MSPSTRELIHVGDLPYYSFNDTVELHLKGDWMRGVADVHSKVNMLVPLMEDESVKVLVYSGQVRRRHAQSQQQLSSQQLS